MAVVRGGVVTAKATAPKRATVPTNVSSAVSKGSAKPTTFVKPTK